MSNASRRICWGGCFVAVALCFAPAGRAQFANLDQLGEQFAKHLKPLNPKLIAVADLSPSEGSLPSQGHYFAQFLTFSIQHHSKRKLPLSDHADFDSALTEANLSPASFASPDATKTLAGRLKQEIVVAGTIGRDAQNYIFKISALRVSDGKILFSRSTTLRRTEFVDSFSESFPPKVDQPVFAAKEKDLSISPPRCIYCPDPEYNDFARRDKVQGTSVFDVLISPEGRTVSIRPVRLIGYGLDEQAFNTIKTWKFKPAATRDGAPVYIIVPVEVTFHLY